MEEKKTGGTKEFIYSVIWAAALLFLGQCFTAALPSYKLFGTIATIIMFCVLGFFVLTRYSAVFTYTLKDGRLSISRGIGHRKKELDIPIARIKSVSKVLSHGNCKRVYNMTTKVFSKKGVYCVVFNTSGADEAALFEPSREMFAALSAKSGRRQ